MMKESPHQPTAALLQPGRVLVRVPNWVGDAVMSLPALRELRRLHPRAHIVALARPWVAALYEEAGVVDEVLPYPQEWIASLLGPRLKLSRLPSMVGMIRSGRFDCALLLQNAFEAAFLAFAASIPARLGYRTQGRGPLLTCPVPPPWFGPRQLPVRLRVGCAARWLERLSRRPRRLETPAPIHQVDRFLHLLHQTGLSPVDYLKRQSRRGDIHLKSRPEDRAHALELLCRHGISEHETIILLHAGAFHRTGRTWFPERFAGLADRLAERYPCRLVLLGWETDEPHARAIAALMKNEATVLTGHLDLRRTLGLLAHARLLITIDSGPMHLAAALGVPQVALFGATDPQITGPLDTRAGVVYKPPTCNPCYLRVCPLDRRCWKAITVGEVFQAVSRLLE